MFATAFAASFQISPPLPPPAARSQLRVPNAAKEAYMISGASMRTMPCLCLHELRPEKLFFHVLRQVPRTCQLEPRALSLWTRGSAMSKMCE